VLFLEQSLRSRGCLYNFVLTNISRPRALTVLLWGTFVSRYIDIVDVTVGTMKNGVVDRAMRELRLLIEIVGGLG
jgi:hypothetical protein